MTLEYVRHTLTLFTFLGVVTACKGSGGTTNDASVIFIPGGDAAVVGVADRSAEVPAR